MAEDEENYPGNLSPAPPLLFLPRQTLLQRVSLRVLRVVFQDPLQVSSGGGLIGQTEVDQGEVVMNGSRVGPIGERLFQIGLGREESSRL
jgi:hypothetical protein